MKIIHIKPRENLDKLFVAISCSFGIWPGEITVLVYFFIPAPEINIRMKDRRKTKNLHMTKHFKYLGVCSDSITNLKKNSKKVYQKLIKF